MIPARFRDRYLRKRFARFNLALADEKTRLLLFGRFAAETKAAYDARPEKFDFLGFTHICGTDRRGTFAVIRLPSLKSRRKFWHAPRSGSRGIGTGSHGTSGVS